MTFYFHSVADFFHMGGYGAYVWSAYGIVLMMLIAAVVVPLRQKHNLIRKKIK